VTEQPSWFRETPESLALLAVERAKVEAAEAAYETAPGEPGAVCGAALAGTGGAIRCQLKVSAPLPADCTGRYTGNANHWEPHHWARGESVARWTDAGSEPVGGLIEFPTGTPAADMERFRAAWDAAQGPERTLTLNIDNRTIMFKAKPWPDEPGAAQSAQEER
jgi:hypothetical protein